LFAGAASPERKLRPLARVVPLPLSLCRLFFPFLSLRRFRDAQHSARGPTLLAQRPFFFFLFFFFSFFLFLDERLYVSAADLNIASFPRSMLSLSLPLASRGSLPQRQARIPDEQNRAVFFFSFSNDGDAVPMFCNCR